MAPKTATATVSRPVRVWAASTAGPSSEAPTRTMIRHVERPSEPVAGSDPTSAIEGWRTAAVQTTAVTSQPRSATVPVR